MELHRIINDREMANAIILVFANKQDLPDGEHFRYSILQSLCVTCIVFNWLSILFIATY